MKFKLGDQIAYIPLHAAGDIEHPDVEFGFVARLNKHTAESFFCRYWVKGAPGRLRTVGGAELTPGDMMHKVYTVDQWIIDAWFQKHRADND